MVTDSIPSLADIESEEWHEDGLTFTHEGKTWRVLPDITITEVNNDNDKE